MKKYKILVLTAIVGLILSLAGTVTAQGWGGQRGMRGAGYGQQSGPGYLLRTEMFNARIAVLAELSEQSVETIKSKLEYKPLWSVIDEYKIDYNVYKTKMKAKAEVLIQKRVDAGTITQVQADFMKERMDQGRGFQRRGRRGGRGFHHGQGWGNGSGCPNYQS